jgi:Predicted ATP-dependent serine protease
MAKSIERRFRCGECGFFARSWSGKCPSCGSWGTLEEEVQIGGTPGQGTEKGAVVCNLSDVSPPRRIPSGNWRTGQGAGWRLGNGERDFAGGGARGRKVDPPVAGMRLHGWRREPGSLRFGGGIPFPGCPQGQTSRRRRCGFFPYMPGGPTGDPPDASGF